MAELRNQTHNKKVRHINSYFKIAVPSDRGETPESRFIGRSFPEPTRFSSPNRPTLHPLPGHVPLGPDLHRGGNTQLHRQRTSQLCQNENGKFFSTMSYLTLS